MQGVEILNETVVYVTEACWPAFFVTLGICAVLGFFVGGVGYSGFDCGNAFIGIFLGALVGAVIGLFISAGTERSTDEVDYIKYQVTISDGVDFNEFNEKYEIIEQDGKLFTIRERDSE